MRVEEELSGFAPAKDTLLSVGVFDGVHLGHKHLIKRLVDEARKNSLIPGVVTFRQHPLELLSPQTQLFFLTSLSERISLLKEEEVELIVPLSFTEELARCSARQFVGLLQKHLRMRGLVVGPDFALGSRREGNIEMLKKLGHETGFNVTIVPPLTIEGEVVSSTVIRNALAQGDMEKVKKLACRLFSLKGRVIKGAGRGAGLGFPTANLDIVTSQAVPADGVYAGWAYLNGKAYPAMTNIGTCPTFGGCQRTVEVYLVDYCGNLYDRELRVEVVGRIRDERKFSSVAELKKQMSDDVKRGMEILGSKVNKP